MTTTCRPDSGRNSSTSPSTYSSRRRTYDEARLHKIITQSLGFAASGQPYGGFRYAAGRDINKAEWPRVYDLICRLWAELPGVLRPDYRTGVNRILAGYRVVWDLGEDGQLHRVLPVESGFAESKLSVS